MSLKGSDKQAVNLHFHKKLTSQIKSISGQKLFMTSHKSQGGKVENPSQYRGQNILQPQQLIKILKADIF